jgi:hypothetical protein
LRLPTAPAPSPRPLPSRATVPLDVEGSDSPNPLSTFKPRQATKPGRQSPRAQGVARRKFPDAVGHTKRRAPQGDQAGCPTSPPTSLPLQLAGYIAQPPARAVTRQTLAPGHGFVPKTTLGLAIGRT